MIVLGELVAGELKGRKLNAPEVRTLRCLRKFLSRIVGFKFRGGVLVDWGGRTSERLLRALRSVVNFYGSTEKRESLLERFGWEVVGVGDE